MVWRPDDPQGNESGKIRYLVVPYTRGKGLDVGAGPQRCFPHWTTVDSCKDTELFGIPLEPDVRVDDAATLPFEDASQDFVFSSHLLEHIEDHVAALKEWWRVLKVGGHLVLYLPHADHYPNIGHPGANTDHKHDFRNEDIVRAMRECPGWELIVNEVRHEWVEYSFLQVFRKTGGTLQEIHLRERPKKAACVVRYGGFGDQLQAANILPGLKRQGYHVTFMTTPKGQNILKEDPHVDEWIIQDNDQVPNLELTDYWNAWRSRFDRFVNLSESVEGTLLAIPGRINHSWPAEMRRKYLGVNYGEFCAEIAQVPYKSEAKFYPDAAEREWRGQYLETHFEDSFAIMWALAGSSIHKFYPWQDSVIAKVLLRLPKAKFVLVGDVACQILEQGWELEPRVIRESGNLDIRRTLTLAQTMHMVVGPETGVLNAVAFDEHVAKVCLLSHSSRENLTKHWKNSFPMLPHEKVECYPCHRLHYNDQWCPTEENSGAAMCAFSIDPESVFQAIQKVYARWEREARRVA